MQAPKTCSRGRGAEPSSCWQSMVPWLCPEHRDRVSVCVCVPSLSTESALCLNNSFLLLFSFSSFQLVAGKRGGERRRGGREMGAACKDEAAHEKKAAEWADCFIWMSFVFLTLLQGKVQYKQYPGSHTPAPARRSLFLLLLLLLKSPELCYLFFPPPPEGICLLPMAFLFSKGRVYSVRNVNLSGGFCSFVHPRKVALTPKGSSFPAWKETWKAEDKTSQ